MITKWQYNNHAHYQHEIKKLIKDNNYTSIDVGATAYFWSYPECKTILDAYPIDKSDVLQFNIDIEKTELWKPVFDYVETNGKFDFSICSHTLEDVFNPIDLILNLEKISKRGYIAIPSKYSEFTQHFDHLYRGHGHHKQFFDIKSDALTIYPKFNWIETDKRSDLIKEKNGPNELTLIWEEKIPYKIFGDGKPFLSDDSLISAYYSELI